MTAVPRRLLGLLAAVIGLVSQLALGSMALPDAPGAADRLAAVSVMCRTGQTKPPEPARHAPHQAICPLSVALALPSVVPAPPPVLPFPAIDAAVRAAFVAQPRAPPVRATIAAQPRGPPTLS